MEFNKSIARSTIIGESDESENSGSFMSCEKSEIQSAEYSKESGMLEVFLKDMEKAAGIAVRDSAPSEAASENQEGGQSIKHKFVEVPSNINRTYLSKSYETDIEDMHVKSGFEPIPLRFHQFKFDEIIALPEEEEEDSASAAVLEVDEAQAASDERYVSCSSLRIEPEEPKCETNVNENEAGKPVTTEKWWDRLCCTIQ